MTKEGKCPHNMDSKFDRIQDHLMDIKELQARQGVYIEELQKNLNGVGKIAKKAKDRADKAARVTKPLAWFVAVTSGGIILKFLEYLFNHLK